MKSTGRLIQFPGSLAGLRQDLGALCSSKLTVPPVVGLMQRDRLFSRLDQALLNKASLTVIKAPAGSGKTSLLASWANCTTAAVAWLSLDSSDNDLTRFYTYFVTALSPHSKRARQLRDAFSSLPNFPPAEDMARLLGEALSTLQEPVVIVLDDYHQVANPTIHEFLSDLVLHLPEQHHMIVTSRSEVPLKYVQLWSRGKVLIIDAVDLALCQDEIETLLVQEHLPDADASTIMKQTAGWAAGVALSVRALLSGQSPYYTQQMTDAYFSEEIWPKIDSQTQDFLLETSLLDILTPRLCDLLLQRSDSGRRLEVLYQQNLFISRYSNEEYRYYPIFKDFLHNQLSDLTKSEIHRRACLALVEMEHWVEAGHHAVLTGNHDLLVQVVLQAADPLMRRAQIQTLLTWIELLPRPLIAANAELALYLAWAQFLTGRIAEAHYWIKVLRQSPPPRVAGALHALEVVAYSMGGTPESLAYAQAAVEEAAQSSPIFEAAALLSLGQAYASSGQSEKAVQAFRKAHVIAHNDGILFVAVVALANLAYQLYLLGQRTLAVQECEWALREYVDENGSPYLLTGFIGLMLGMLLYAANDIDTALGYLKGGIELSSELHLPHMIGPGEWHYALALEAAGRKAEADAVVEALKETALRNKKDGLLRYAKALQTELTLRRGELSLAASWAEEIAPKLRPEQISLPVEHMAYAYAMYKTGDYPEALRVLLLLEAAAREHNRQGDLVSILLLRARVDEGEANNCVRTALEMAVPETLLRPFIDAMPEITRSLMKLSAEYPAFVARILEHATPRGAKTNLYDLSERELELILLVASGLSNQQISERLFISVGTTKWHLNNIYSKLGVARRAEAVSRSRELGLIP